MENKKGVSGKALKKTLEYVKENHNRLSAIENVDANSFTCENTITTVPDNVTNNIKLTSVQGKTLQNVFNYNVLLGNMTLTDERIFVLAGNQQYHEVRFNEIIKPNTTYTFVFDVKTNTIATYLRTSGDSNALQFIGGTKLVDNGVTGLVKVAIKSKETFTGNETSMISFGFNTADDINGEFSFKLMVLEGDWTNKEIPPYFEGIQSVQNPLDVQVTGKNLLDLNRLEFVQTVNVKNYKIEDNKITVTSIESNPWSMVKFRLRLHPYTTYTFSGVASGTQPNMRVATEQDAVIGSTMGVIGYNKNTFTTDGTGIIRLLFYGTMSNSGSYTCTYSDIQLELNATATAYEPYVQPINYAFPFDRELRSLSNGVCDEIKDGKLIKRIEKITLDGSGEWGANTADTRYYLKIPKTDATQLCLGIISENYIIANDWETHLATDKSVVYYKNGGWQEIRISIKDSNFASLNAFKEHLKENPITLYVELLEPENIELETIYNNPVYKVYANGNIIQNNALIHPTLTFAYQTGLQGKISDLQVEVEQHESELRNMLANETGLQTVTERVSDLVMQDGNIKLEEMQGNTMQNLIQTEQIAWVTGTYTSNGDYINISKLNDDADSLNVVLELTTNLVKPSTTYTLLFMEVPDFAGNFNMYDKDSSTSFAGGKITNNRFVFTTLENTNGNYWIYYYQSALNKNIRVKNNLILLEGDWTGKEIPAYFTGIKSVNEEQTGLQVKSVGKNLFDLNMSYVETPSSKTVERIDGGFKFKSLSTGTTGTLIRFEEYISVKPDTTYTLCWNIEAIDGQPLTLTRSFARMGTKDGRLITVTETKKEGDNKLYYSIHTPSDVTRIRIGNLYPCGSDTGESMLNRELLITNIFLYEGTIEEEPIYEPYKESVITIPYAEPLRRLPNGVADTIEDGKVIRRVANFVLDETYDWREYTPTGYVDDTLISVYVSNLPKKRFADDSEVICDKFIMGGSVTHDAKVGMKTGGNERAFFITLKRDSLPTPDLAGFKQWVATNNIHLVCPIDTPIVEEIPEITLAGYKHLIFENDIVPTSATVSFANSNYARLVALEKSNVDISKQLADIWGVLDVIVLQVGNLLE